MDEHLDVLDPGVGIRAPLAADRRRRLLAHAGAAAHRAADVAGPDLDVVAQAEQAVQRRVQLARAVLGLDGEVGPRDVADEQRVAGQERPVVDEERAVLGTVARARQAS